jgi:hypothetical protein
MEVVWGKDLRTIEEDKLSEFYDTPIFVTDYPKKVKAFYMKDSENCKKGKETVLGFDMIGPEGSGELIGGSQREESIEKLRENLKDDGENPENYEFYLDMDVIPINITVNTVMTIQKAVVSNERLNSITTICGEKAQISGILLGKKSPVLGKKYGDLKLKQNIFAIERGGELVLPNGDTTIAESDIIFVVAPIEDTENIFRSLRGESH